MLGYRLKEEQGMQRETSYRIFKSLPLNAERIRPRPGCPERREALCGCWPRFGEPSPFPDPAA